VRLTIRFMEPGAPQDSHFPGAGSDTFWKTSMILPQFEQAYS